jgi:hypothetical protein
MLLVMTLISTKLLVGCMLTVHCPLQDASKGGRRGTPTGKLPPASAQKSAGKNTMTKYFPVLSELGGQGGNARSMEPPPHCGLLGAGAQDNVALHASIG